MSATATAPVAVDRLMLLELDDILPAPAPVALPAPEIVIPASKVEIVAESVRGDLHLTGPGGLTARAEGEVYSTRSLAAAADLAWSPELTPIVTAQGAQVPREIGQCVVRSDNGAPLGIVGARYTLLDHSHLFDLADALGAVTSGGLRFANAGHKAGGARPFVQLRTPKSVNGVDVESMLSLFTSHDGTLCLTAGFSETVIVCRNTYAHALANAKNGMKIKHTASAESLIAQAKNIAQLAAEHSARWNDAALKLMSTRFSDSDMRGLAEILMPGDSTRTKNNRDRMLDAWASAPGAQAGTAWGAAQAVTYYTSHYIGSEETRADTTIFGSGLGADMQADAWGFLNEDSPSAAIAQRLYVMRG